MNTRQFLENYMDKKIDFTKDSLDELMLDDLAGWMSEYAIHRLKENGINISHEEDIQKHIDTKSICWDCGLDVPVKGNIHCQQCVLKQSIVGNSNWMKAANRRDKWSVLDGTILWLKAKYLRLLRKISTHITVIVLSVLAIITNIFIITAGFTEYWEKCLSIFLLACIIPGFISSIKIVLKHRGTKKSTS